MFRWTNDATPRKTMRRRPRLRRLFVESLESRRLLAGDACSYEPDAAADLETAVATAAITTSQNASIVSASDAGSTRGTAANIGSIDGTRQLHGTLGWNDDVDVIQFSVDRDAEVRVDLFGLNRNANLYLADSTGSLIERSRLPGRSSETISSSLDSGDYFVIVTGTSFRLTSYQLSIATDLAAIVPTPETATAPTTPAPSDSSSSDGVNVAPLQDVAYFGNARDWNVNSVGAPEAWAAGYTGQGVTVAVVDTGVDLDHPDLVQNLYVNPGEIAGNGIDDDGNGYVDDVHGYDFADRDADPDDVNGHGTHVAGTIAAASNGFGATGIAPDATILPVRVLGSNGSGDTNDVAAGIRYAASLGADIINLSLGGSYSRAIDAAIDYARSLGSLIVAAAGNESASVPSYPALFSATDSNVISVGAYSSSGTLAGFSNQVGRSDAVQVDAPGAGIFSTYVGGRYATLSGTSMASPHVAGLAALTLSSNPSLTSQELRDLLATGTVGRALRSDAIGSVNATTTVAYAAAGLSVSPNVSSAANQNVTTGFQLAGVRATEVGSTTIWASRSSDVEGVEEKETEDERTPEVLSERRSLIAISEEPVETRQWARNHDDYFSGYASQSTESEQTENAMLQDRTRLKLLG